jgi:hypothetical protein
MYPLDPFYIIHPLDSIDQVLALRSLLPLRPTNAKRQAGGQMVVAVAVAVAMLLLMVPLLMVQRTLPWRRLLPRLTKDVQWTVDWMQLLVQLV